MKITKYVGMTRSFYAMMHEWSVICMGRIMKNKIYAWRDVWMAKCLHEETQWQMFSHVACNVCRQGHDHGDPETQPAPGLLDLRPAVQLRQSSGPDLVRGHRHVMQHCLTSLSSSCHVIYNCLSVFLSCYLPMFVWSSCHVTYKFWLSSCHVICKCAFVFLSCYLQMCVCPLVMLSINFCLSSCHIIYKCLYGLLAMLSTNVCLFSCRIIHKCLYVFSSCYLQMFFCFLVMLSVIYHGIVGLRATGVVDQWNTGIIGLSKTDIISPCANSIAGPRATGIVVPWTNGKVAHVLLVL